MFKTMAAALGSYTYSYVCLHGAFLQDIISKIRKAFLRRCDMVLWGGILVHSLH
jgi:hypothetical protein